MEFGAVIEGFNVIEDGGAGLGVCGEAPVIGHLIFEAAPEGFDKGVIVAVPGATHGSEQTVLGEDLAVSGTGELTHCPSNQGNPIGATGYRADLGPKASADFIGASLQARGIGHAHDFGAFADALH